MNFDPAPLCEIRVPTFRRPKLLERALISILHQTYAAWRCIVFDDCPDGSARSVVTNIKDSRIAYFQNPKRLGAIGNIDRSFHSRAICGGQYAFVLEDDNYLLPIHIENAMNILQKSKAKVVFSNQFCEQVDVPGEPGRVTNEKTLNWMYSEGLFDPKDLLPALLFSHGFTNGAAFWRTDCLSEFQIGEATKRPGIQETMRLLRLREPVYVSLLPTSVWRWNDIRDSFVNTQSSRRNVLKSALSKLEYISERKEKLNCIRMVVRQVGLRHILDYVRLNPERPLEKIERSLLLCGYNEKLTARRPLDRVELLLKGCVIRYLAPGNWRKWMT
jgi:glycosyltransferase involved in cell wall biosynthesis